MNKQEAIRELMSKSREIIFGDDENVYLSRKRTIELVSQIDEPQKVVVPKFVADWIVEAKKIHNNLSWVWFANPVSDELNAWLKNHTETFMRAWLDGYEIEKEKQWVVKNDTGYLSYLQFSIPNICYCETSLDKNDAYKFKSKSKADLFAYLVTGTVEEVTDGTE